MQRGHPPPQPPPTSIASSISISRAASPSHPLHLPPSPLLPPSPNRLLPPPSPSPSSSTSGVRSRKSASSTPTLDAHVTRPSLQRITSSSQTITPASDSSASNPQDGTSRGSLDELSRPTQQGAEREIILHELAKTDTIASISLQYGITPQALRSSNRLWPSDSIHLRKTLNIPLDQCHLPSASAGFERIVREDDGNLVVWQRGASEGGAAGGPSPNEAIILSPKARRLASASALEMGVDSRNGSTADLIGLWGNGSGGGGRSSFDLPDEPSAAGLGHGRYATTNGGYHDIKGKGRYVDSPTLPPAPAPAPAPADDAVANYLSTTHNPYASSSSSSSSPAPLLSLSPAPAPPPPTDPPPADLQKRTLTISRVPSSSLSFFPPSASTSNPSSARSSISEDDHHPPNRKGSFFGPLANSLARLNLPLGAGEGRTGGGLGSWSTTANSTRNSSTSSLEGGGVAKGGKVPWTKRWDLSYFGGEEEEAAGGGGMGMQGAESWRLPMVGAGRSRSKSSNASGSAGGRTPKMNGSAREGKDA